MGEYEMEETEEGDQGRKVMKKRYGLKAFHPIAKGFPYTDYDDFGVSRTYGYRRAHLGHDMMGQTGTPVVLWNPAMWRCLDGISMADGVSGSGVLTGKDTTIMHICGKDFPISRS